MGKLQFSSPPPDNLSQLETDLNSLLSQFLHLKETGETLDISLIDEEELKRQRASVKVTVELLDRADLVREGLELPPADEASIERAKEVLEKYKNVVKEQGIEINDATKKHEDFNEAIADTNTDTRRLTKNVGDATDQIGDLNDETAKVDIQDKFSNIPVDTVEPEEVVPPGTVEKIKTIGPAVTKSTEEGKKGLTSLGVFAANVATEISKSFSNFISTALKGDFDGIEETQEISQNVIKLTDFKENKEEFRLAA